MADSRNRHDSGFPTRPVHAPDIPDCTRLRRLMDMHQWILPAGGGPTQAVILSFRGAYHGEPTDLPVNQPGYQRGMNSRALVLFSLDCQSPRQNSQSMVDFNPKLFDLVIVIIDSLAPMLTSEIDTRQCPRTQCNVKTTKGPLKSP